MIVHFILLGIIVITSITAFSKHNLFGKYQFNAVKILRDKQFYRLFTHGFLHGSWTHLLVNLFVLFSFGMAVVKYLNYFFPDKGTMLYLILFITALPVSSFYSLSKERNNYYYNAIGASGAVSAVVFASIFFNPYSPIYFFGFIKIPGIIFGILYLAYSKYMSNKNIDNVGHDAHFWGAVYGFIFPALFNPVLFLRFLELLKDFSSAFNG